MARYTDSTSPETVAERLANELTNEARRSGTEGREANIVNTVSSVEALHGDLSHLESVMGMLSERLHPVINDNVPVPDEKSVDPRGMEENRRLSSELTGRVLDARARITYLIQGVETLQRTLDLP